MYNGTVALYNARSTAHDSVLDSRYILLNIVLILHMDEIHFEFAGTLFISTLVQCGR